MIGAIPNPKKSVVIDYPIAKATESMSYLNEWTDKYQLTSTNAVFHQHISSFGVPKPWSLY